MADAADTADSPDPRFLAGVDLFNRGAFFDAHEVWEELWRDCPAPDRRFYQALIQAAVALHHFDRGNHTGAARLYRSGRRYMEPYRPAYRGIVIDPFWDAMAGHLAVALGNAGGPAPARPEISLRPV
ncbi:hypothetical protein GobsT_33720 [Gemmata obscuriglobus]|uniref:DUF309 domain-containing protein n=1 Tax=Gemmata obscuriglobus TaxID=114 RepID=A0A2Z3H9X1_9BACT|nr:DUF309 domain-containing protein [Gemmata obscuriglobus]AWM38474.1 DUF309 domain-containing protein [Gemmata obscuriglobus]QEG28589.1 hypothetical protein GobsT_33720 [Gemmata obscuriglobus]VTS06732.1 Uncharacterized protein OS=Blastopirellula marina DSM 3645 GN=DSM3645_01786 PE=4 SV=1: DUF309 [Gemmata obscuriglobus UQM 2246]